MSGSSLAASSIHANLDAARACHVSLSSSEALKGGFQASSWFLVNEKNACNEYHSRLMGVKKKKE